MSNWYVNARMDLSKAGVLCGASAAVSQLGEAVVSIAGSRV